MKYKVLNTFIEKEHDNHLYKKDDVYPAEGFVKEKARVEYLQKPNAEYDNKVFLDAADESEKPKETKKEEVKDAPKETKKAAPKKASGKK